MTRKERRQRSLAATLKRADRDLYRIQHEYDGRIVTPESVAVITALVTARAFIQALRGTGG